MLKQTAVATAFLLQSVLAGFVFLALSANAQEPVSIEVLSIIKTPDIPRIGLNLGEWSIYGASQFMRNVLKNPGFEGQIDRAVVVVAHADRQGFDDDTSWTGRPDGFWSGAHFDIRTGAAAGQSGMLADSRRKGRNGLPTFATQGPAPALAPGDVVVLSRSNDQDLPTHWQVSADTATGQVTVELNDKRPGSPGRRSLALSPVLDASTKSTPQARITAYLDSIGERSGKLLPIDGRWKLSLWARSASAQASLRISFQRAGSPAFLNESRRLPKQWKALTFEFNAQDQGPAGTLSLELVAEGGKVLLDDVSLEQVSTEAGAFRPEVVAALGKLKPGYLRDWQGQLGDSWENLIAPAFGRRTDRYRPGPEDRFGYGLADFLDLCKRVGANPWLVLPTTLNDGEYEAYGRYLAERIRQQGFTEAVVEFGNENWNMLFRPGGIPNPTSHGIMAQRAFAQFKKGAGAAPVRLAVNGQHVNPNAALKMLDSTPDAQVLAVAPYLLLEANRREMAESPWPLLFQADPFMPLTAQGISQRGKALAVYEVNLHTTRGDIAADLREQIVAGEAAGSALAKRLLEALNLGVRRQCVYNFAQYDFAMEDRTLVKLWGVMRDLGATRRMRPTGLAMALMNSALPGDAHALRISGKNADTITATAIRRADGWALALVSASSDKQAIQIKFPADAPPPRKLQRLDAPLPSSSNEDGEDVRIVEESLTGQQPLTLTVPAWGFVVVSP